MKQLKLNAAALAQIVGGSQRIRIRTANLGDYLELQIRPTDRASAVNLPKGETLADLDSDGAVTLPDDALAALGDASFLVVQPRKHGWFALVNAVATGEGSPGGDIT